MVSKIKIWLAKRLKVRLIDMTEEKENRILSDMRRIDGIEEYFQLEIQLAYQFYAATNDKKYLGYADLSKHLLNNISKRPTEEETPNNGGYESTI